MARATLDASMRTLMTEGAVTVGRRRSSLAVVLVGVIVVTLLCCGSAIVAGTRLLSEQSVADLVAVIGWSLVALVCALVGVPMSIVAIVHADRALVLDATGVRIGRTFVPWDAVRSTSISIPQSERLVRLSLRPGHVPRDFVLLPSSLRLRADDALRLVEAARRMQADERPATR